MKRPGNTRPHDRHRRCLDRMHEWVRERVDEDIQSRRKNPARPRPEQQEQRKA
jgi:hypothetical protein